ncbi:MAG: DUF502 domain-containing protein [Dehalococcoidales bacterium]
MKKEGEPSGRQIIRAMRKHFLAGILVVVPLAIAVLILVWVFTAIDDVLQPIIKGIFGRPVPGLGFGVAIVLVYIVGIIASNFIGKRVIRFGESLLERVPMFRQLYTGAKQVVHGLSGAGVDKAAFREVVFVEFPREGMKTIAFVTNELLDKSGKKLLMIFIPTAPIPTSGYFEIVTEDKITRTDISVDEAMGMIISSGMIMPDEMDIEGTARDAASGSAAASPRARKRHP